MTPKRAWLAGLGIGILIAVVSLFLFVPEVRATGVGSRAGLPLEYLVVRWDADLQSKEHQAQLNAELNALGKDGWELITGRVAAGTVMIFKRPK